MKPVEEEVFIPRKGEAQDVDVSKWMEIIKNPSLLKSTLNKVYKRIFNGESELAETLKIFVLEERNISMSDEIEIERDRPGQFAFKLKCAILNGVRVDRELLARGEAIASLQDKWTATDEEGVDWVWGRLRTERTKFKRSNPKKSKNSLMKKIRKDAKKDVTVWAQKAISKSFQNRSNPTNNLLI
ncbi:Protein CBG27939 [Caenorhabditis briggsae]|nr:Protein CBG27939 [Caenorhabditis briggsae]CAS00111.1 Protein CBG27939 [Caenorhabditis briggsae]